MIKIYTIGDVTTMEKGTNYKYGVSCFGLRIDDEKLAMTKGASCKFKYFESFEYNALLQALKFIKEKKLDSNQIYIYSAYENIVLHLNGKKKITTTNEEHHLLKELEEAFNSLNQKNITLQFNFIAKYHNKVLKSA